LLFSYLDTTHLNTNVKERKRACHATELLASRKKVAEVYIIKRFMTFFFGCTAGKNITEQIQVS
jgi:hypothetical protein